MNSNSASRATGKLMRPATVLLLALLLMLSSYSVAKADDKGSTVRHGVTLSTTNKTNKVTLEDIRDLGICLIQIKQQAENLFIEVTRERVPVDSRPIVAKPEDISSVELGDGSNFLPARPDWLIFYVGTLEPIIHLFREDLRDNPRAPSTLLVPKGTKDSFVNILASYEKDVDALNECLNQIYDSIGEKDNNIKIARSSIKLFQIAEKMETSRVEAFDLLQRAGTQSYEEIVRHPRVQGETK